MTALVILTVRGDFTAGGEAVLHAWQSDRVGFEMTSGAFAAAFPTEIAGIPLGTLVASTALILFVFTTLLTWSYYGERAITFLYDRISLLRSLPNWSGASATSPMRRWRCPTCWPSLCYRVWCSNSHKASRMQGRPTRSKHPKSPRNTDVDGAPRQRAPRPTPQYRPSKRSSQLGSCIGRTRP